MRTAKTGSWLWLGGAALVGAALTRWQMARWFTEHPSYARERKLDSFEIRRYAPHWVAETRVESSWEDALEEGFHRLAGYIFGNNHFAPKQLSAEVTGEDSAAPSAFPAATVRPSHAEIAMTAPVQMQRSAPLSELTAGAHDAMSHIITFHLPRGRTAANLPTPNDERVQLTLKPEARVAV
ncbi:MAG: hypothetical protein RL685_2380, partial [Pseudomonadota bacterium]